MSTPLPATGDAPEAKLCDARDLVLAHLSFRRLYSLAPDAVRRVGAALDRRLFLRVAHEAQRIQAELGSRR